MSASVLPTHVGMSRLDNPAANIRQGAPHTRGDEPMNGEQVNKFLECSPHTWG